MEEKIDEYLRRRKRWLRLCEERNNYWKSDLGKEMIEIYEKEGIMVEGRIKEID